MTLEPARKDILSGLVFIGFGAAFAIGALGYPLGTGTRMGAGFFPLALSIILVGFGIAVVAKGVRTRGTREDLGIIPWRGVVLILGALIFFGLCVRGLGLIPTLFVTVFASGMASRTLSVPAALALAAGMAVLCYAIFIKGLGVTVPVFGPWLPF